MRSSLFVSSLLPLLLFSIVSVPCSGQVEDSFGGNQANSDPADVPATQLSEQPKVDAAESKATTELEDRVIERLKSELKHFSEINKALKNRISELDKSVDELNLKAEEAAEEPLKTLHQELFDSLLFSDEESHQELALKHMIACIEKHRETKSHIAIHSVDVQRRVKLLIGSESETVREMAAGCLYVLHPDDAAEIGIQFNAAWKPLEHIKSDHSTRNILDQLKRPYDIIYDEAPLWEIVDDIKTHLAIGVRLAEGIDAHQTVTFESTNRTFMNSLAGLLESKKLGFAIKDEEIVIMKNTDPELISVATYNVSGLDSLGQIKTEAVLKLLKDNFSKDGVEFSKVSEHVFTAKANFKNHHQIQERIATLVPPTKWYSR